MNMPHPTSSNVFMHKSLSLKRKLREEENISVRSQKRIAIDDTYSLPHTISSHRAYNQYHPVSKAQQVLDGMEQRHYMKPQTIIVKASNIFTKRFLPLSVGKTQHAVTMDEWLSEWRTAPDDPIPSNIRDLFLLQETAWINLGTHAQKAQNVLLRHYYADMVPEARAQQELKRQQERKVRTYRYHGHGSVEVSWESERAKERQEVIKAAQRSYAIDLSGHDTVQKGVLRRIPGNLATRPTVLSDPPYYTSAPTCGPMHVSPSCFMWKKHPAGASASK
jgi:hypothetical protein